MKTLSNATFFRLSILAALVSSMSACRPSTAPSTDTAGRGGPIVIGVSLPLTGRFSEPGSAALQGYQVWVELVNEAGGLLERQVELKVDDNGSDQVTATADYERLISADHVDLVVGPFSSFLVIPTSQVAASHGYAFIEPAGGAPEVFERGLTNLFFAQPARSSLQADPFGLYILGLPSNQRPRTYALVGLDDPFTVSVMDRLQELFSAGGLDLVFTTKYPEDFSDFDSIATQVAALDPDLIIGGTQVEDSISQIRAYKAAGYQPRFAYFTNGPTLPGPFKEALGPATEGIFSSISWFPEADEYQNKEFVTKYISMFGGSLGDIPEDAANAFTVGQVLEQAVRNAGSIDNKVLIEELHRGRYDTIVGPLGFDEVGAPQGSFMLLQWQGDNFVIVGPAERAEKDPTAPPKPEW